MNFSQALETLKRGSKISRAGWNGKGLRVEMNFGFKIDGQGNDGNETRDIQPFFTIFSPPSRYNTWVPSVSDILSEDWELVE